MTEEVAELECARVECQAPYTPSTHNQKYCSNECLRIETNAKMIKKYHDKMAIKRGKPRYCSTCEVKLSRYNTSPQCSSCEAAEVKATPSSKIADILNNVIL